MATNIFSSDKAFRFARRWLWRLGKYGPEVRDPLLHIGVRKAASTYLQHYFARQVHVRKASMERLEHAVFDGTLNGDSLDTLLPDIEKECLPQWNRPYLPGMHHVVSNERFGINPRMMKFVRNDDEAPAYYDRFWTLTVGSLKQLFPDARVLIITRAAPSWIKSAYSQAVRGAMANHRFPAFVRAKWQYLSHNMDYERMRDLFAEAFGADRVLFLPQELLREDPERFFSLLSQFAGFRLKPGGNDGAASASARNASPEAHELDLLLNAWRFARLMDKYGRKDHSLFYRRYITEGVKKIERVYKGYARNCIEFRSSRGERLWQNALAQLSDPPAEVEAFRIPDDRLEALSSRARFLCDLPGYEEFAEAYAPVDH